LSCQDEGLLVDRAIPYVTACWNRFFKMIFFVLSGRGSAS
jgi:hypothetical protein